ncbi:hypothetical protein QO179_23965 [Bacillus stercoris]|nr:hypothetical protein [Bacillus stercoris]
MKCPLCEHGDLILKVLKSENEAMKNVSHLWVCDECPGVLLEWWDDPDTKAFAKYLDGDHSHVIKDYNPEKD